LIPANVLLVLGGRVLPASVVALVFLTVHP
jgi:hypothetical protein